MAKFRKKPVVIEAVQWLGNNLDEIEKLVGEPLNYRNDTLSICTLEGTMQASLGDMIIKGVNGEFYPCKPDIFEKTYNLEVATSDNYKKSPMESFEEAAQPLMAWMEKNCCPHDTVIVTVMNAELCQGKMVVPSEYNKKLQSGEVI